MARRFLAKFEWGYPKCSAECRCRTLKLAIIFDQSLAISQKRCRTEVSYFGRRLKPRPHQQQCRSNIVECYKSNDSFDKVECCFDIVVVFGNNVAENSNNVEATFDFVETTKFYDKLIILHYYQFWQQSRILLRHYC